MTKEKPIGPHEGIEFELYEKGLKNVILLADDLPLDDVFSEAKRLGAEFITATYNPLVTSYIFYRPSHINQALRLKELLLDIPHYRNLAREQKVEHERETGQILGYKEWQIKAFIESRFGVE